MWHKATDKLPDRNTKYASNYGVPVLVFDEDEFRESGSYTPHTCSFNFEKKCFMMLTVGLNDPDDGDWIKAPWITHWCELPDMPERIWRRVRR